MKRKKELSIDTSYNMNCMSFVNQTEKKTNGLVFIFEKKLNLG